MVIGMVVFVFVQTAARFAVARAHGHESDHKDQHGTANGQHDLPRTYIIATFVAIHFISDAIC